MVFKLHKLFIILRMRSTLTRIIIIMRENSTRVYDFSITLRLNIVRFSLN